MLNGIDVSQHQGDISWTQVAHDNTDFVIVKATEGQDFVDPRFSRGRVTAIRNAGLRLGVYHYLRPRPGRTGAVEARFAVKTAKAAGWGIAGDIPLAVDVEETAFSGKRATRRYVQEFVREYHELTGHYPIFYSFPHFITSIGFGRWLAKRCKLWLADLGAPESSAGPWRVITIRQFSFTGRKAGIAGDVDLNRARRLPRILDPAPAPVPVPTPSVPKVLTRRQRLVRSLRHRRARFLDARTDAALRKYLFAKARLGIWDKRYCLHWGPNPDVNKNVKAFVTRGFAAGLVPTSLRRPPRFAGDNSHHTRGNAGDMGVRRELLPLGSEGLRRMRAFQAAELRRARRTKAIELELIGPDNEDTILRGRETDLAEGTPLENQHDNHVHGAFSP